MAKKEAQIENVWWLDVVLWGDNKLPKGPAKMMTRGFVYGKKEGYLIIKHPLTYQFDYKLKEYTPKSYGGEPTFFLIPLTAVVERKPLSVASEGAL